MKFMQTFAKVKNFAQRTTGYLGLVNSAIIVLTYIKVSGYNINLYLVFVGLGSFVILIGFLDYMFVLKHEFAHLNSKNNIKADLDEIKKILKSKH